MNTLLKKISAVIALFVMQLGLMAQNKIIFSDKPFWNGGTEQTDFKANGTIYGRIILDYALRKYCRDVNDITYDNNGKPYASRFSILLSNDKGEKMNSHSILIRKDQLENKYLDFDIAPDEKSATTPFTWVNEIFSNELTATHINTKIILGSKNCFVMSVDNQSNKENNVNISEIKATGNLCIDYTSSSVETLNSWSEILEKAANAGMNYKPKSNCKMVFSSKPFAKGGTEQTEFKAGTPIYGRIILPKALKEYNANPTKKSDIVPNGFLKSIVLLPVNGGDFDESGFPSDFTMFLTAADLEKNYIDFDVMPTEQDAKSPYDWDMAFYRAYANTMHADTRKKHFAIKNQQITSSSSFTDIDVQGDFYIEYDGSTSAALETWASTCEKAHKAAKANASKNGIAEGAEMVKKLPLPNVFNKASSPGYKSYSSPVITQMIKSYLKVTEVYMLCYGPNKEQTEFEVRKNERGVPISKTGNLYFYFIFKDTDGFYKASGAYLIQPYEGGGKYGAAYMRLEGCITEGDATYPLDVIREKNGFNYIVVVDGAKVKKQ